MDMKLHGWETMPTIDQLDVDCDGEETWSGGHWLDEDGSRGEGYCHYCGKRVIWIEYLISRGVTSWKYTAEHILIKEWP